jgi:hypothetical protein
VTKPTIPKSIPRSKRRQAARIVAGMSPEDRAAWDEMVAEDGEMLMLCLQVQYERGGVFDLEGIKKHFRLSRILVGEEP